VARDENLLVGNGNTVPFLAAGPCGRLAAFSWAKRLWDLKRSERTNRIRSKQECCLEGDRASRPFLPCDLRLAPLSHLFRQRCSTDPRIDTRTGRVLWVGELPRNRSTKHHSLNNAASPSPVCDTSGVVVFFADFGLSAWTRDGIPLFRNCCPEKIWFPDKVVPPPISVKSPHAEPHLENRRSAFIYMQLRRLLTLHARCPPRARRRNRKAL
jgi:hypothetical protein